MRMRSLLGQELFEAEEDREASLVCQYSSLGSLQEEWLFEEFGRSMTTAKPVRPSGLRPSGRRPNIQLVWPTVEQVRTSLQGYAAGGSIPCDLKNLKQFLYPLLHRWDGQRSNRAQAMPHIKTFLRYVHNRLLYVLLTSSNLSSAAWGKLEKRGSQLMVRSFELGVLFLPSTYKPPTFSLLSNAPRPPPTTPPNRDSGTPTNLFHPAFGPPCSPSKDTSTHNTIVQFPIPYRLPPPKYTRSDRPWFWNGNFTIPDRFGRTWPPQN